ncbi:uncharacterized protein EI90DRAFT_696941 [Cantharellus anzutake]|uniref:uncharacterized protein n=1 Tax=Cantharellus anzutake TaxID=1750568 RepID=UPI0019065D87|nr:uncharacterized protein EI90DRAFT_696941 [Cantharellus anzutake]KAF8332751.1 hypothetical protein EI90DRAFT_696941 [Cantharellus anzutake]
MLSRDLRRSHLPYDLLYETVALLDFETLKSFSLVSRDCRLASSSRLWKAFTICIDYRFTRGNYKLGSEFLQLITRFIIVKPRAGHIQDLRIRLHSPIGPPKGGELMVMQGIDYLFEGIRRLTNLRSLEFHILVHQRDFAHALRGMTFSPHLERFATNLHSAQVRSFDELFLTMQSIKSIRWMTNSTVFQSEMPISPLRNPLPNLTELIVCSVSYTALMCGSPVTHLTIHDLKAEDPPGILKHIQLSTRDLTHLEVHVDLNVRSPTISLCPDLIQHIPSLRYLRMSHRCWTETHSEEGFESLRILGDLPFLREFVWTGGSSYWHDQLLDMMERGRFSSLQRAIFGPSRPTGDKTKYLIRENGKAVLTEVLKGVYLTTRPRHSEVSSTL